MAELLADIDDAFASDPAIDELGVIMSPPPPNLVLVEHKLGLSYKILKPLFVYAITEFYRILQFLKNGDENISNPLIADKVMRLTRATLLVKGDMPMFYNLRKILILADRTCQLINAELTFLGVLFTRHPKSPSSWQHRRWCLQELFALQCKTGFDSKITLSPSVVDIELILCTSMSESYPKNYYSWMHRLWLLQFMNIVQLESELIFTRKWLMSHVSDHSAANHRMQVILRIKAYLSKKFCGTADNHNQQEHCKDFLFKINPTLNAEKIGYRGKVSVEVQGGKNRNGNLYDQFIFLDYVFQESKQLTVLRPGNETLWSHIRAAGDLMLQFVSLAIEEIRTENESTVPNAGCSSIPVFPSVSQDDFTLTVDSKRDQENTESSTLAGNARVERTNSGSSFQFLQQLLNGCGNELITNATDENNFLILSWMTQWLKDEAIFCENCLDNTAAWNYGVHRQMSLRYYTFVLARICAIFATRPTRRALSNIIDGYIDEDSSNYSEKKKFNATPRSGREEKVNGRSFEASFQSFLDAVRHSLVLVTKQLRIEDSLPRMWATFTEK